MGPEKSASTERAWDFVRRYWLMIQISRRIFVLLPFLRRRLFF
jgi:hypothetical protein